ncbi:hypothetical protein PMAC_000309 [Pneumocystis sp. 'macacae']|nr:hypothetical protein PMAC_000309 [Pneumocystis sp. 'macacae']
MQRFRMYLSYKFDGFNISKKQTRVYQRFFMSTQNNNMFLKNKPHLTIKRLSHVVSWKMYGRPFGRVFLIASITYFGLHFLWWKLYVKEKRAQKQAYLSELEKMVFEITSNPQSTL